MLSYKGASVLLDKFEFDLLERTLVRSYIDRNNLDINNSEILSDYFDDYEPNVKVNGEIGNYNISTLEELENCLEVTIPKKDRNLNGAFFTPSYIVDFIIRRLDPKENDKNLDPSCGCGAFLMFLAEYYKERFDKPISASIRENIYGIDILPYNIRRAKVLLSLYALQNNEELQKDDFNILVKDSLKTDWIDLFGSNTDGQFDNIVGNPPYIRIQDLPLEMRVDLSSKWESINNGSFNLYFAFFELGYNLLKDNGKLGYITPNNYFTSLAGKSLREFFQIKKCITEIIDFRHRKVFEAQAYTSITFMNKKKNAIILYDRIDDDEDTQSFLKNISYGENKLEDLQVKKWRLLKPSERDNINKIESIGIPLGELLDVRVGLATLKDELYFVDGSNKTKGYYIKEIKGKEYKIEEEIARDVYKISDFKNQDDCDRNQRKIIVPYFIENDNVKLIDEKTLEAQFPYCYSYLVDIREELDKRSKGRLEVDVWYEYGRQQGLTNIGKKLVTPTFSKSPRFLVIDDENALFTNGYGIYFKNGEDNNSLFPNPLTLAENIYVAQKILNSKVMHYFIHKTSVSIAGGYYCYQKNFIERFTIPGFTDEEIEELRTLEAPKHIDEFLISKYQIDI